MAAQNPVLNLAGLAFDVEQACGRYTYREAIVGAKIGARKLGYNVTELRPGKARCPYHCHHGDEEMFLILEGEGELRFGYQLYPLKPLDVIACPPGGPEVAHQIVNTGTSMLRYLAVSTRSRIEICEYPDSGKAMTVASEPDGRTFWRMFRTESGVDYYDGEDLSEFPDRPAK